MTWNAKDGEAYEQMFSGLSRCIRQSANLWRAEAVSAAARMLLCSLFSEMEALADVPLWNWQTENLSWRDNAITVDFIEQLSRYFKRERSVSFYASCLCITPKSLSRSLKSVTGITAREWIDRAVVEEISRLLSQSRLSVKEIVFRLNFSNISSFGKYFKKHTGLSPRKYRDNHPYITLITQTKDRRL